MTPYLHGGVGGLRVGDLILPPATTGVKGADRYAAYKPGVYRRDRVYVVTSQPEAMMYAALYHPATTARGGDVYRVTPIGELEPDLDCLVGGLSWQCPWARVDAIVCTAVRRKPFLRALADDAARERKERWRWIPRFEST